MTVLEFEAWVSENYESIRRAARRAAAQAGAEDMLHDLIESICSGHHALPPGDVANLTPGWFGEAIRCDFLNSVQAHSRAARRHEAFAASLNTLGPEDTYQDPGPAKKRKADRVATIKKRGHAAMEAVSRLEEQASRLFSGSVDGNTRWRFQTLRDNRLFDERAIRSLAGSMHKASRAYRHFGEQGFAFSEFGQEASK